LLDDVVMGDGLADDCVAHCLLLIVAFMFPIYISKTGWIYYL
jgi:hypothetical protein